MYNKLFTKILDSSIWLEDSPTRIVWLTFIAVMDEKGFAPFAAAGNVANRARVSLQEAKDALAVLEAPDTESSDPENEGRRIERVPGGWMVLNAEKHRDLVTRAIKQAQTAERVRRFRERVKRNSNASVTTSEAEAEARSETESETKSVSNLKEQASLEDVAAKKATSGKNVGGDSKLDKPSARSKRPIFTGTRFVVFDWQLDDLRRLLGKQIDEFYIDEWFHELNTRCEANGEVIPQRDGGKWLQEQTINEARRRGLVFSATLDTKTASTLDALNRFAARGQA